MSPLYTKPAIRTMESRQLIEQLGPALANGSGIPCRN